MATLEELLAQIEPVPTAPAETNRGGGMLSSAIEGVSNWGSDMKKIPSAIASLGDDAYNAIFGKPGGDLQAAERVLTAGGKMGTAGLMGAQGAISGSIFGPVGTVVGGALGGGLGLMGFDSLNELLGNVEKTTLQDKLNNLSYNAAQDLITGGLASTAKGALRTAKDIGTMTTDVGQKARAVGALKELGVTQELLDALPDSPTKSIAELADDADLARIESQIPQQYPETTGTLKAQRTAGREAFRTDLAEQIGGQGVSDTLEAGTTLQKGLQSEFDTAKSKTNLEYSKIPKDTLADVSNVQNTVLDAMDTYAGKGSLDWDGDLAKISNELLEASGPIPFEQLQNYKMRLSDYAATRSNMSASANQAHAGAAKMIAKSINELEEFNANYAEAVKARKYQGKFEDRAVGAILEKDRFGNYTKSAEKSFAEITKDAESAKQFAEVAPVESKDAMSNYISSEIQRGMEKGDATVINQFIDKTGNIKPQYKIVVGDKLPALEQLIDDLRSEQRFNKNANQVNMKGAQTYSRGQIGNELDQLLDTQTQRVLIDKVPAAMPLIGAAAGFAVSGGTASILGGMLGQKVKQALKGSSAKSAAYLYKALTSKSEAQALLKSAGAGQRSAIKALEQLDALVNTLQKQPSIAGELGRSESRYQEQEKKQSNLDVLLNQLRQSAPPATNQGALDEILQPSKKKVSFNGDYDMSSKVDPKLIKSVIKAESSNNPKAVGPVTRYGVSAQGLMQLMPATGKEWHKKLGLSGEYDPFNAEQNETIGTAYLGWLKDQFDGDLELSLAAYNYGIGKVKKALKKRDATTFDEIFDIVPRETQDYVKKILRNYNTIKV